MRFNYFLVLLFVNFNFAIAQDYSLEHYTDENGLPQNSVKSIATDNAGFIWLATENGLVRYDGQKFLLFDKTHTRTNSNRITNLRKNINTNKLYALTERWQINEIQNGTVNQSPVLYNSLFSFKHSAKEDYYFATGLPNIMEKYAAGMPYIIQKDKDSFYRILNGNVEVYYREKLVTRIQFSYKDQWRFFILNHTLYHLDNENTLTSFEANIATKKLILGDLTNKTGLHGSKLFWNTCTGDILLGTGNTLYTLEQTTKGNIITKLALANIDYNNLAITTIYLDKLNKAIYLGSYKKGLFIYKRKEFKALASGFNTNTNYLFYAQVPYQKDAVLYSNGLLFKNSGLIKQFALLKNNNSNFTILLDKDGRIWNPNGKSIYQFSNNLTKIIKTYTFNEAVSCLYQSANETIWVGTLKGVYKLMRGSNNFARETELADISDISYLQQDDKKLWVATHKGLYAYDLKTKVKTKYKEFINKDVRSIYLRNKEVWVTTYGDGFYLIKEGFVTKMPNDNNNYINTSHCILEDKNGFFWISTNKGLFQIAITDLLAYSNNKNSKPFYLYYNRRSGFNTNEFNGGCQPCGSILQNGLFSFPTLNDIILFDPLNVKIQEPNKPIYIDNITLDNKPLQLKHNTLTLPNIFNELSIHVTSPYFGNSNNLNFEYKLIDQAQWLSITDQRISYSALPTGKNILLIRKANGFGINNYAYKQITINIPKHYYETWWFIIIVLASIAMIIYLYIKIRTRIIRNRNKHLEININERTFELQETIKAYESSQKRLEDQGYFQRRLIASITHDIKSPLKFLMMTGKSLYDKANLNSMESEGIKAIYTSSTQIYHFTENLLEYAKGFTSEDLTTNYTFNLNELVEEKIRIFEGIAKSQNTKINNRITQEFEIKTNRQLLAVILHNLLDNAIKFTNKGQISFDCKLVNKSIQLTINDTGIGMKPHQVVWCNHVNNGQQTSKIDDNPLHAGLGLIMVKELIKIINGKMHVEAILGKGTAFELTFPSY